MRTILSCLALFCFGSCALAQAESPVQTLNEADAAWSSLTAQLKTRLPANKTAAAPSFRATVPDYGQVIVLARAFQNGFPDDPRANRAKKIELASMIRQQRAAGQRLQPGEDATIDSYVKNQAIPAADRYDISALSKEARASHVEVKSIDEARALRARDARELAQEFPGDPRGYGYLLATARSLPSAQAREIAHLVLDGAAPEKIKEGARSLLAQKNMEGNPLRVAGLDLDAHKGHPVIIYTWSSRRPDIAGFFKRYNNLPGIKLIGVNVDADADGAKAFVKKYQLPGAQYYDLGGMAGPIASALHIQSLVSVYIIDGEGKLADTRGREDFEAKIKALSDKPQETSADEGGKQ